MPYNFEATFTQPLLTKLDNGLIGNADDWADAITTGYIDTIKAGLPQGAPTTLPAPGLNPTSPPPFTIGAAGFSTADSRSKVMYNVVRAYFLAKEVALDQGSIESLIASVKQLIQKIKARYDQVKAFTEQIILITKELAQLPTLLAGIVEGLRDRVRQEVENVKQIFTTLKEYEAILGPQQFQTVFARELVLINTIQNFDVKNIAGIRDITLFVTQHAEEVKRQRSVNTDTELMKRYVRGRLFGIAKQFLLLAEGVIDPTRLLGFLSSIKTDQAKLTLLIEKIKRFDFVVRYIQPQLKKLEAKKLNLIKRIKEDLQPKLKKLQDKVNKKIEELKNKIKTSKAAELYAKASKTINDQKKKNEKKIKIVKSYIQLGTKGLTATTTLVGKSIALVDGLKVEFTSITEEIKQLQKTAGQTQQSITGLQESATSLREQITKQRNYFNLLGLNEFAQLGALVITQTKCDFETFKYFFERRSDKIKAYAEQIMDLERSFEELLEVVEELRTKKKPPRKRRKKSAVSTWLKNRVKSLKDLLRLIITWLRPKLQKIEDWIRKQIEKAKEFLTKTLNKFKDELIVFAANLIPLKSDVQDVKDKAAVAQDKINKAKDKIAKLKKLLKLASFIAKMASGAVGLGVNLAGGKFKFSENETNIDNILDGWFGFRMEDKPQPVQQALMAEKMKYREDFQGLLIIELLITALIETFTDVKNSEFVRDLKQFAENAPNNIPAKNTALGLVETFSKPPTNPLQWKATAEQFSVNALNDITIQTELLQLEKKYLLRSREVIKKLCDIKRLQGTKIGRKLAKVKNTLDKDQSLLAFIFDFLAQEIKKFFVFVYEKVIRKALEPIKKFIKKKTDKIKQDAQVQLDKIKEKAANIEAPIMSFTLGLAARLFWTGATWQGPTGTTHLVLNIGEFKPMKAKSTDGASAMIREMADGFELQLQTMFGLLTPPANTGIPPIPFNGYK